MIKIGAPKALAAVGLGASAPTVKPLRYDDIKLMRLFFVLLLCET